MPRAIHRLSLDLVYIFRVNCYCNVARLPCSNYRGRGAQQSAVCFCCNKLPRTKLNMGNGDIAHRRGSFNFKNHPKLTTVTDRSYKFTPSAGSLCPHGLPIRSSFLMVNVASPTRWVSPSQVIPILLLTPQRLFSVAQV